MNNGLFVLDAAEEGDLKGFKKKRDIFRIFKKPTLKINPVVEYGNNESSKIYADDIKANPDYLGGDK